jgi:membrane protease YdiL (CAAX protease family)
VTLTSQRPASATTLPIPQYTRGAVLGVWAAAALPMAGLAWLVAPRLASSLSGPAPLPRALVVCLLAGLVWQFALVATLVGFEQRSLRWATLREVLWLRAPRSPRTGRSGGRLWLLVLPLAAAAWVEHLLPAPPIPLARDMGAFLGSDAGLHFLHGNWTWFALIVALFVFNTVLGEELLFRGLLLPRMNGAFGDADWLVNGVLFGLYHLHEPWAIPGALLDTFVLAYPSKRYRSALMGIAVHSGQTVFFVVILLALVLQG